MKKEPSDEIKARKTALKILTEYERRDAFLNLLLEAALSSEDLERRERSYVTELVLGTVRMKKALDFAIECFTDRKIGRIERTVAWLLRMAAYQCLFMNVPDYAVCDTSVEIAKSLCGQRVVSFVNAVLRALIREKDSINWPDPSKDLIKAIAVRHSHPEWVVKMWLEELGREKAESLCAANNQPKPVSIRVNNLKTKFKDLRDALFGKGISLEEAHYAPECLLLRRTGTLSDLTEYREGLFTVQDEASMLVTHALSVEPGMRVLDVCAAPGGKATHIAQIMQNRGRILALDINKSRIQSLITLSRRLGIDIIETMVLDSRNAAKVIHEKFDRVLVDVPCSGLGTLARKPDARWRRSPDDIPRLSRLQIEILTSASELVRREGILVYSACTISRRETKDIIHAFLSTAQGFEVEDIGLTGGLNAEGGYIQLFPDVHGCDGMYIARLKKLR